MRASLPFVNVNLTRELEELVQSKVRSGLYNNQSEVVREALRLMAERDRLREAQLVKLRAAVAEGIAQADRSELEDADEVFEELRALLRERRARKSAG
jgi:antitoxin ParD1/3/4